MKHCVLFLGLAIGASACFGSSLYVERDGTGDYTDIIRAMENAASGDTVYVGPGRYDETTIADTPGYRERVRILVTQEEITVIGAGVGLTFIGPADSLEYSQYNLVGRGVIASSLFGSGLARISGMTFENLDMGFYSEFCNVTISDCHFDGNRMSLLSTEGEYTTIDRCEFRNPLYHYAMAMTHCQGSAHIRDCRFVMAYGHEAAAQGIHVQNTPTIIERCQVIGTDIGIGVSNSDDTIIRDCLLESQSYAGLIAGSDIVVQNTVFDGQHYGIVIHSGTSIEVESVELRNVSESNIFLNPVPAFLMHGCSLDPEAEYLILAHGQGPDTVVEVDCRGNYWGTTDTGVIDELIYDVNDDPELHNSILYEPILDDDPTPVKKKSLSDVRQLFRTK